MRKPKFTPVRTLTAWNALPAAKQDVHRNVVQAVADMRRNPKLSLRQAATDNNTTPGTVQKYAGSVIRRGPGRRFTVAPSDRFYAPVHFYTAQGRVTIGTTDSRARSKIGRYMNAVDRYLKTGLTDHLKEFRGQSVRVQKVQYPFITNPRALDRLANANEISFEDLYARAS
jgi:hypothetical protein